MILVIDPSVATKWFLHDERASAADAVLDRIQCGDAAYAPALFRWEVQNVFLEALRAGRLMEEDVYAALDSLRDLPVLFENAGEQFFTASDLRLAQAYDLTVYDAAYLSTAERLDAELVTADVALARAGRNLGLITSLV